MRDIGCSQIRQTSFNAEFRLKSWCILLVNVARHGGQIESLRECNYGRWGLGLCGEPSVECPIHRDYTVSLSGLVQSKKYKFCQFLLGEA